MEFLNAQMAGIEAFAVEIKQFKGHSSQTLVPRVIGRTAASPHPVGRRSRLNRESFLPTFSNDEHRAVAVRLLGVAGEQGADLDWYSNGVGIQIPCSLWKRPVGVTWLFPPSEWGKAVLRGLTDVSVGTSVGMPETVAALPEEKPEGRSRPGTRVVFKTVLATLIGMLAGGAPNAALGEQGADTPALALLGGGLALGAVLVAQARRRSG